MTHGGSENLRLGKVAVLLGGQSAEREISLLSGQAVLGALSRRGVDAHALDAGPDVYQVLKAEAFDRVFIALHGRGGEDGSIQGALEILGLPYTGSGVLGSALGMDKYRSKLAWRGAGLPTPEWVLLQREADLAAAERLGFPLMMKPVHEGSSIGMTRVEGPAQLLQAWRCAAEYDPEVLAERWIDGAEYTAGILEDEVFPLIRLETPRQFYDYEAKYHSDSTRYLCPCGLPVAVERQLQQLALRAFRALGASGWGRVDFFLDAAQNPWLIEINTVPGMTDHSLVPMAAKARGMEFDELVWRILQTSLGKGA
jgi:D-alanine-D-alanine ligase